jgi:phage shock protein A
MNLLERVLTLLGANLNTVVEKADDPQQVLRQLQIDMRNQLVQVKTQVATAIAESHKLQRCGQERKGEANKWLKKAELAVQQRNDDTAREALIHYNQINRQIQRYQQQRENQEQIVGTMRNALRQLEAKIAEVDTTIDLLATHKRNALIQQRVYEALNKSTTSKDDEQRPQTSPLAFSPQPLERTPTPNPHRQRKGETQTETLTSKDLDIEQLKERLDMPNTSTS